MTERNGSRANGTNPRATQQAPRDTGANERAAKPSKTAEEILALVKAIDARSRETQRQVGLILDKLNIPLMSTAPSQGVDGGRHLPGSQPFGTRLAPEPEPDPIPGASPATARAMLRKAQEALEGGSAPDGHDSAERPGERNTGAVVVPLDTRSRKQHPAGKGL